MVTMTAADPFLRAVIADPDDDLPRLIYADALDAGDCPGVPRDAQRAEFIRAQVELAQVPADLLATVDQLLAEEAQGASTLSDSYGPDGCEVAGLRRRERELWQKLYRDFDVGVIPGSPLLIPGSGCELTIRGGRGEVKVKARRGFVSQVTCTAADWLAHADALLAACPVRGRRVDDRHPDGHWSGDGVVRLTTWPELFMVVGEQSVSLTASNDFRVRPGIAEIRLLDDGHVCVKQIEPKMAAVRAGDHSRAELVQRALAAEWPGVRFEFPPAARPEQLNWATIATMTPRRGTGGRVAADPPGDPRGGGVIGAMERTARLTGDAE